MTSISVARLVTQICAVIRFICRHVYIYHKLQSTCARTRLRHCRPKGTFVATCCRMLQCAARCSALLMQIQRANSTLSLLIKNVQTVCICVKASVCWCVCVGVCVFVCQSEALLLHCHEKKQAFACMRNVVCG